MMLAKIESWEQKKNIMLSKSKLKEKKGERMYIDDDLTKEERETQKKLRELAREERENRNGKEGEEREKVQEVTRG
jgi:hypothetical protein